MAKRLLAPRTRNAGTMTEFEFLSMIHKALRKLTYRWKPSQQALEAARRPYKGPKKQQKHEYQCNDCKDWFKRTEIHIDHVVACGSMQLNNLPEYINQLFAEGVESYQVLCKPCHKLKSNFENSLRLKAS